MGGRGRGQEEGGVKKRGRDEKGQTRGRDWGGEEKRRVVK